MLPIIFVEFWAARNRKMCVLEFQFFEKTFTLWLKKLWGLGRNEALSYLGSELFAKKKFAYSFEMADLCSSVKTK